MPELMPTIFFGHGNPMHAVSNNGYTDGWTAIGASLPSHQQCGFRPAGRVASTASAVSPRPRPVR